jgi:hypothetical protein
MKPPRGAIADTNFTASAAALGGGGGGGTAAAGGFATPFTAGALA